MWKLGVLGLVLLSLSDVAGAGLPADVWYFSSTFRETLPDGNRGFSNESGAQYQFGRTLGRHYALDFGFQDQVFDHKHDDATTAQSILNISLRRFFGQQDRQWYLVGEAGQIRSKTRGQRSISSNLGLGLGVQHTAWKEGPSLSADLRYRMDYNDEIDPAIDQYTDWVLGFSMTIPFFNKTKVLLADRDARETSGGAQQATTATAAEPIDSRIVTAQATPPATEPAQGASNAQTAPVTKQVTATPSTTAPSKPTQSTPSQPAPAQPAQAAANSVADAADSASTAGQAQAAATTADAAAQQDEASIKIQQSIAKLRSEITALEREEEIEKADFSANTVDLTKRTDLRNRLTLAKKINEERFVDRKTDTDQDGVADFEDKCSDTPLGAPVDSKGCALDTDGDKVIDLVDLCAGTPKGVSVDDRGCGFDDDLDGVPNHRDRCADTVEDVSVDANGCEKDSDNDGVADSQDQCEGTAPGVKVEVLGCQLTDVIVLKGSNFQVDSSVLTDGAKKILTQLSESLQGRADTRVELAEHSGNNLSTDLNKRLSMGRVNSAKLFLLELGVDAEVKTAPGQTSAESAAGGSDKDTDTKNLRVEMRIVQTQ